MKTPDPVSWKLIGKMNIGASTRNSPPVWRSDRVPGERCDQGGECCGEENAWTPLAQQKPDCYRGEDGGKDSAVEDRSPTQHRPQDLRTSARSPVDCSRSLLPRLQAEKGVRVVLWRDGYLAAFSG